MAACMRQTRSRAGAGVRGATRRSGAQGYRRHGIEALADLRGRFALVIWEAAAARGCSRPTSSPHASCTCGRFRAGWCSPARSAELLPLLATRPAPDPVAFPAWLVSGAPPEGRTLYDGIHRIGPGECVTLRDGTAATVTYWRPRFAGTMSRPPP